MESTNQKRLYQVAEIELTYKSNVKPSLRPRISTSKDAYEVFLENWDGSQIEFVEQFKVMFLNRANKVLGIFNLSTGGVSGTVADPKVILLLLLKPQLVELSWHIMQSKWLCKATPYNVEN